MLKWLRSRWAEMRGNALWDLVKLFVLPAVYSFLQAVRSQPLYWLALVVLFTVGIVLVILTRDREYLSLRNPREKPSDDSKSQKRSGVELPGSSEHLVKVITDPPGQCAAENRTDAHQQIYELWRKLKNGLWDDNLRDGAADEIRRWMDKNGLALGPDLREKIRLCLCEIVCFPGWRDRNERAAAEFQEKVIGISKDIEGASDALISRQKGPIGPRFIGRAVVRSADARTGLSFIVMLDITNDGDRTAREVCITVRHDETECVAASHDENVWEEIALGMLRPLNPRRLRARHHINPKQQLRVLTVPLCERTTFPFRITLEVSAEDMAPSILSGIVTAPQANQIVELPAE